MSDPSTAAPPGEFRILPKVTEANEHYWRGGEHGRLMILRCRSCGYRLHPPTPVCPTCLGRDLAPEAVSGKATVATFTVNHQAWYPGLEVPFVLAIVELDEQPDVRITTNIVNCPIADVRIGLRVQVVFRAYDDVWIPFFEPEVA
jgi:uncharacterized protein